MKSLPLPNSTVNVLDAGKEANTGQRPMCRCRSFPLNWGELRCGPQSFLTVKKPFFKQFLHKPGLRFQRCI